MSYSEKKITQAEVDARNVKSAPDVLVGNAGDNKQVFDSLPEYIVEKYNSLMDDLDGTQGDIDADISSIESDIDAINETLATKADNVDFAGATATQAGEHGLVPPLAAGNRKHVLFGSGQWHQLDIDAWQNNSSVNVGLTTDKSTSGTYIRYSTASIPVATPTQPGAMSATDKSKLDNIAEGAEVNVQSDWNDTDTSSDAYIRNKPTIDAILDPDSENAVQNKAIVAVLDEKADEEHTESMFYQINSALAGKVDKVSGKGLSTNDYTTAEKNKLAGIAAGAEVNVQSDWNQANTSADDYIKNKPTIVTPADLNTAITAEQTAREQADSEIETIALNAYINKTASGAIATFTDGADMPAKSVVVDIEPIQDLHGYDHPWAGGGGKNLSPQTAYEMALNSNVPYIVNSGVLSPYATTTNYAGVGFTAKVEAGTAYVLSSDVTYGTVTSFYWAIYDSLENATSKTNALESGTTYHTFTPTHSGYMIYMRYYPSSGSSVTWTWNQCEKGTTATSYLPYANICPISGWSSVDVYKSGVNVWDEEWEQGDLNSTTGEEISSTTYIRGKNYTPCRPNVEYYGKANSKIWLYWYDQDKNYISNTSGGFQNTTKTAPSTAHFFRLVQYASTYDNGTSINYPSTDTSYHAYNGHTTTTSLGRTVYGGTLDVVSGVLTVDRAMVDAGSCNWDYASAHDCFYTYAARDNTKSAPSLICSAYPYVGIYADLVDKSCAYIYGNAICVRDSAYNQDPAAFKSAMSGVQLVYELATPTTYTLTPTEIQTLLGENNVWADSGDVEVVYRADPTLAYQELANAITALGGNV